MTRTAEIGSIGILAAHVDESGADAKAGREWTLVSPEFFDKLIGHARVEEACNYFSSTGAQPHREAPAGGSRLPGSCSRSATRK